MTKPYRPSNGSEGLCFFEKFCFQCGRDEKYHETQEGEYGCPILAASFYYEKDDPLFPGQYWVEDEPDGTGARCLMFVQTPRKVTP